MTFFEMRSTITSRGQTVIPASIRKKLGLGPADALEWVLDGDQVRVIPVRRDPIAAFMGRGKGGGAERLIAERRAERDR